MAYPPGTVRALIESDLVTPPTRRALRERLQTRPGPPRFFGSQEFAVIKAAAARLIPQPERERPIDLAAELDARLADGTGDGWRYAKMPPDREMHSLGVAGFDESAQSMFGCGFAALAGADQDSVLRAVQSGKAQGQPWAAMDSACYFEELLALLVDIYYAHPLALEEIGFAGMADGHGWQAIGLDEREAHEPLVEAAHEGAG